MPRIISSRRLTASPGASVPRSTSAMSAMMPPSPRLSARMMNITYFTDTTSISDQSTSDTAPSTWSWVAVTA